MAMAMALLWLGLTLLFLPPSSVVGDAQSEALLLFRRSVAGSGNANLLNWSNSSLLCSWKGVNCSADGIVTGLRLPGLGLAGPIPPGVFSSLPSLSALSLRSNSLSGSFPSDLSLCTRLKSISLQNNQFSGPLPTSVSFPPRLQRLDLSFNAFGSVLPPGLANLTHLTYLFLQNNEFEGELPPIGNSTTLVGFSVANNRLNGTIPPSMQKFGKEAFAGNNLCGPPLAQLCPEEASNRSSPVAGAPEAKASEKKMSLTGGQVAGIVAGSISFIFFLLLFIARIYCFPKTKTITSSTNTSATDRNPGVPSEPTNPYVRASQQPRVPEKIVILQGPPFAMEDLLRASAEVLGKGSVGTSYKAKLGGSDPLRFMVVKRVGLAIGFPEFKDFVNRVDGMRHENLRRLLGYHYSEKNSLLIYDYMDMGSLSSLLHGSKGAERTPLKLGTRQKIALDTARAIAFLHGHATSPSSSAFECTHGNIKSSNVLLKGDGSVYVSDYGLTQMAAAMCATGSTKMLGYGAPEVTEIAKVTPKADVYSFGVLLLEILTGKPPPEAQGTVNLTKGTEMLDPDLLQGADDEQVRTMEQLVSIALECTYPSPHQRPTMEVVVSKMGSIPSPQQSAATVYEGISNSTS